ncbi:MAG TPA: 8-amino-7-oxononanoate synthase [Candidatus Angelobacter sp.]|nr:8-amino-7-oxononanoate synthase [Candidatus Angelobacter sp.]
MTSIASQSLLQHLSLTQRIAARLKELEMESQARCISSVPGVNLSSNDYLGLSQHPRLKEALREGIETAGRMGSTGSRLLSGHHAIWDEVEEEFAAFAGTEAALCFSSGFAANTGLLAALLGPEDVVFSDALNHASIIDGIRLGRARKIIYPHGDLNRLEDELRRQTNIAGAKVIVTESLFSMDGDCAPLCELFALARRYTAEIIVDEAHATGTHGPNGRGLVAELGLQEQVLAIVHTGGKALASMGGFVCGSRLLRQFLINRARSFIFSTALPPYMGYQLRAALRLAAGMDQERQHLASLSTLLRERLHALALCPGTKGSHIIPLIVGSNAEALRWAEAVAEQGFAARAIRPPSVPRGTARLRLSLTAALTREDIKGFTRAVTAVAALKTPTQI